MSAWRTISGRFLGTAVADRDRGIGGLSPSGPAAGPSACRRSRCGPARPHACQRSRPQRESTAADKPWEYTAGTSAGPAPSGPRSRHGSSRQSLSGVTASRIRCSSISLAAATDPGSHGPTGPSSVAEPVPQLFGRSRGSRRCRVLLTPPSHRLSACSAHRPRSRDHPRPAPQPDAA